DWVVMLVAALRAAALSHRANSFTTSSGRTLNAVSPLPRRRSGVDPVRRTSWLCRVSGLGVADLVLVGGGRAIAERGVQPTPVEEHLDVVEHGSARVRTG